MCVFFWGSQYICVRLIPSYKCLMLGSIFCNSFFFFIPQICNWQWSVKFIDSLFCYLKSTMKSIQWPIFEMDNRLAHAIPLNVIWQPGVWGRLDTCIHMAKLLHCSPLNYHSIVNWIYWYKIKSWKKCLFNDLFILVIETFSPRISIFPLPFGSFF